MESSFSLGCRAPPRSGGSRGRPREIAKRRENQIGRARARDRRSPHAANDKQGHAANDEQGQRAANGNAIAAAAYLAQERRARAGGRRGRVE